MHFRTVSFFVFFSRRKGLLQFGHCLGTGLSHVANLHVGNVLQLKKTFPFLETFWISSPSVFLRAFHASCLGFDMLALGLSGAGGELSIAAVLIDHGLAAFFTLFS